MSCCSSPHTIFSAPLEASDHMNEDLLCRKLKTIYVTFPKEIIFLPFSNVFGTCLPVKERLTSQFLSLLGFWNKHPLSDRYPGYAANVG